MNTSTMTPQPLRFFWHFSWLASVMLFLTAAGGCGAEPPGEPDPMSGLSHEPIVVSYGANIWSNKFVPVCWEIGELDEQYDFPFAVDSVPPNISTKEKQRLYQQHKVERQEFRARVMQRLAWIQRSAEQTWGQAAGIHFQWMGLCTVRHTINSGKPVEYTTANVVRVFVHTFRTEHGVCYRAEVPSPYPDEAWTIGRGTATASDGQDIPFLSLDKYNGVHVALDSCEVDFGSGYIISPARWQYLAVREFGHVLGFDHDQANWWSQPSNPDLESALAPFASRGHEGAFLSEGDIQMVRDTYGHVPVRKNAVANVDGMRYPEVLALNPDGVYALSADPGLFKGQLRGSWGFEGWTEVSRVFGAVYGARGTAFADATGDGKADAIIVEPNAIYVADRSVGYRELWTSGPFYGYRKTLFGDVNGDGRTDVVAINYGGNYVALASGRSFVPVGKWSDESYGTVWTELADVDGDGMADLVMNRGGQGIFVRRSSGYSFFAEKRWYGRFLGTHGERLGDVSGDGQADLVAINGAAFEAIDGLEMPSGAAVLVSTGDNFRGIGGLFGNAYRIAPNSWTDETLGDHVWEHGFFGSRDTLLADMDADGFTDIVAIDDTGVYVGWSDTGYFYRFEPPFAYADLEDVSIYDLRVSPFPFYTQ